MSYTYDTADRLTSVTQPSECAIIYTRDDNGNLTTAAPTIRL